MFDLALNVVAPVVGRDESHRDCTCSGVVIALPDGTLKLYAEAPADLEALGWGILAVVEEIRTGRAALTAPTDGEHAHA